MVAIPMNFGILDHTFYRIYKNECDKRGMERTPHVTALVLSSVLLLVNIFTFAIVISSLLGNSIVYRWADNRLHIVLSYLAVIIFGGLIWIRGHRYEKLKEKFDLYSEDEKSYQTKSVRIYIGLTIFLAIAVALAFPYID